MGRNVNAPDSLQLTDGADRSMTAILTNPDLFSAVLYERMQEINTGIADMEPYEFRYALNNLAPESGDWGSVAVDDREMIEARVNSREFYSSIQIKPCIDGRIVLDATIVRLARMLFVGLVMGAYAPEWINTHFYFDIRGFYFLHRTVYFTAEVLAHLGDAPFRRFEPLQQRLERRQEIGYREFREANAAVDGLFIESVGKLIRARRAPILIAVAGPTAAGKTEIVERLHGELQAEGRTVAAIEMDNFLTDREQREEQGIFTLSQAALHFCLLQRCLADICAGRKIVTPRYDFVYATSSHDLDGALKPGCTPIEIEPADVVFIEGNSPFLFPEITPLIGVKVVYFTDDPVRLKRKWRRDIDYRKKYEPTYFRNRYFREQFLMAERSYRPQMTVCDLLVDTTGAALWAMPEIAKILANSQ